MKADVEIFRQKVIDTIDMTREPDDEELHNIIDTVIENNIDYKYMPINDRVKFHKDIYDSIRGLGIIEELIANEDITEIMINGVNNIYIEKEGRIEKIEETFISETRLNDVIQQIVGRVNKRVNETTPIVDTRLEDGSRVNVVLPPVAIDGAVITIRKFPKENITMEQLIRWESITREAAAFLKKLVIAGYNIFISGGTGSGKTTFLNALSNFIPEDQRVITIEDSAELQLNTIGNLVRMEARQANSEGNNEITIRDLIKTSLRMRPDRIIVGEVRGEETLDMLQAMNTGHDGSMSTGHSNSTKDMLARLETMVLTGIEMPLDAIRAQIASGIDIIVHLGRLRDKSRKVLEIAEVTGYADGEIKLNPLYIFGEQEEEEEQVKGKLIRTEYLMINTEKMERQGIKKWGKEDKQSVY
ncbi:MAG: CpaF family protein [Eubacterium sp.]